MRNYLYSLLLLLFASQTLQAQQGTIRGTVIEDATGEPLIGVTVIIEGTATGAATDLDGAFAFKAAPGTYNIQASFISFETVTVQGVVVTAGEVTNVGTIRLGESAEQLEEVVISAEAVKTTEAALLTIKRKSPNLLDGISSETFSRIGDSDAAGAIRRVPGVSIQGGQYVFVRGLGDRYTKTIVNAVEVPGLDPDRNAIQIDIFPTNVINNIIVFKNFTPDLSADFVGGTVDIETEDFPDEKKIDLSVSFEFNPDMHFQNNFLTYDRGGTDFLGFDNGDRELPFDAVNDQIPAPSFTDQTVNQEIRDITLDFNSNMAARMATSGLNGSLSFSAGNQIEKEKVTLGYIGAFGYRNTTQFFEDAIDATFEVFQDASNLELERQQLFQGPIGINDVQLSGLLGGSIKTDNSKFRVQGMHIQNGTSRAGRRFRDRQGENFNTAIVDVLEYSERSLTNFLIAGEHYLPGSDSEISWRLSPTFATVNDLDLRITPFSLDNDPPEIDEQETGEPNRLWRLLDEQNYVAKVDYTKNFQLRGLPSKFKGGLSNIYKERDFELPSFFLDIVSNQDGLNLNADPDRLLALDNIFTVDRQGVAIQNNSARSNSYRGRMNTFGAYVMGELGITEKLKSVVGLRVEQYDQWYTGNNQAGNIPDNPAGIVLEDENILSSFELFPSVNLIYSVIENSNLRASYYRTIARPSFKEKSFAEIQDVLTGFTFIGNIDLIETNINNYDLRWEYFLEGGQTISIGGFYKTLQNPIEIVRSSTDARNIIPRNVGDGEIIGVELEVRKNLDFISPAFENFLISANVTYTDSQIDIDAEELEDRQQRAREGETISTTREFLGQSPLITNVSLNYNSFTNGWQGSLAFNRQSSTLAVTGGNFAPDTFTVPFNSLNLNVSKAFGVDQKNTIGLRVTNVLGDIQEREFVSFGDITGIETSRDPGTGFRIKYSRTF
ncbi:MAG: TonB-dependent receptor [Bacteroidota bacterium]